MNEERKIFLMKMRDYSEKEFDRLIVYISTGAIVLTTIFLKDIIKTEIAHCKILIIIAWILFTVALFIILISHRTSTSAIDKKILKKADLSKFYNKVTIFLNYSSLLSLFLGVLFFIIFISINI